MNENVLEICDDKDNVIFTIEEEMKEGSLIIKVAGDIKNEVAHDFEDEVIAALSVCNNIIINFEKVTYLSSAVLRSLLSAQRIIDDDDSASMIIENVNSNIMNVFVESGFSDILCIKNS
jgi:anti-sigma B factor antagonist